jgi:hypothetical protein
MPGRWGLLRRVGEGGVEPVGTPLPYITGDGVEAEGIGWKAVDGAGSGEAVFGGVDAGELALPDVAEMLDAAGWPPIGRQFVGRQFISPRVELLFEATACGVLPLGFGGKRFANPCGIGVGVVPGDVDDGVIGAGVLASEGVRAGAFGM